MANTILFYDDFNIESARKFNTELFQLDRTADLTVRINTPGGDVETGGEAMISGLSEVTGKKTAIVDGFAASMGAMMLLYFDEVILNDAGIPKIMFHKAAFPSWYKPSKDQEESLSRLNDNFEKRIKRKVDGKEGAEDFISKVFEKDKRNDVYLTAEDAIRLGIATSIRKIEPTAYEGVKIVARLENTTTTRSEQVNKPKKEGMEITLEQLETAKKEAYASGVKAEQDRVGAWLALAEIDSAAALKGASDPEAKVTQTVIAQFTVIAMKKTRINAHADDNAETTTTTETGNPKPKEQVEAEAKQSEIDGIMSLKVTL
jgi:ATP-dependent protease ClpP protease subunit